MATSTGSAPIQSLVMAQYNVTFKIGAVGNSVTLPSQTFSKAGYKPVFFASIPGDYMDTVSYNCGNINISGNNVITGDIYVLNSSASSVNKKGTIKINVLYLPST